MKFKNQYIKQGVMLFLVGLALILAFFAIHNTGSVKKCISTINGILMPFYLGITLAYLLCPIYNWVLRTAYPLLNRCIKKSKTAYRIARGLSTTIALGTLILIMLGFFYMLIPDLVESVLGIISVLPTAVERANAWFTANIQENTVLLELLQDNLESLTQQVLSWIQETFLPGTQAVISGVSVGIIGLAKGLVNGFIALIICVYVLNRKELFQAQTKKLAYALFKPETAEEIFELGRVSNVTFGGFINGKIIDSIIMGILCFIVMTALGLPIASLVSLIIGLTNIIPFFGPFIGAIPSILLLLIIDPLAALKFAIMILLLQQIDVNIIGPKILGNTTGLASFWVMFAIIVGGGLFGFIGMILGVPLFAVFYVYVAKFVNIRLRKKGMDTNTMAYKELGKFHVNKEDVFGKDYFETDELETDK